MASAQSFYQEHRQYVRLRITAPRDCARPGAVLTARRSDVEKKPAWAR